MEKIAEPVKLGKVDHMEYRVYESRREMGEAACRDMVRMLKELLAAKDRVRMVFAAAPSQNEFLEALIRTEGIDWSRVEAFHMDEYIGLPEEAPQRFGRFLSERLFDKVRPGRVELVNSANGAEAECVRYSAMLREAPVDIVCLGIGENGHIAFNDPPVADFDDPAWVKPVELEEACRVQQVNDGCFTRLEEVPTHALTLTVPALMSGANLFCIVPGPTKREAVNRTLEGPVSTACPATIMRRHPACTLYLDKDSYGH